jgi:hypothetical protein
MAPREPHWWLAEDHEQQREDEMLRCDQREKELKQGGEETGALWRFSEDQKSEEQAIEKHATG